MVTLQSVSLRFRTLRHIITTQLAPDSCWCKEHAEECAVLTPLIDLTGYVAQGIHIRGAHVTLHSPIGKKTFCTVGSERDHVECDGVIHTDDDGVFLVFEARGATNPLDSPSALFVTDIGEDGCVYLNGGELPKKIAVQVRKCCSRAQFNTHHRCNLARSCSWASTRCTRSCATTLTMHESCIESVPLCHP